MHPPVFYYACTIVNQGTSYPTVCKGCHSNCSMNVRNHNAQTCEWDDSVELIVFIVRSVLYSWFQTFAVLWMLCAFFWVISQRLSFIWRFGTLCLFHLHRWIGKKILHTYQPMKMEQTKCCEMLAYKLQTPGNYPEESIRQICNGSSTVIHHQVSVLYWK